MVQDIYRICDESFIKKSLIHTSFISRRILNDIQSFRTYTFFSLYNIDVYIFCSASNVIEIEEIDKIKLIISTVLQIIPNIDLNIKRFIHIYNSDYKRFFDKNITVSNINGGYRVQHTHTMYVFRKEDLGKVLIHEMLHELNVNIFDALGIKNANEIHREMEKYFQKHILVNEAHVDAIALFINTLIYAKIHNKNMKKIWRKQYKYSKNLMMKILKSNYLNSDTNCIAYYVLKPFIMRKIKLQQNHIIVSYDVSCFSKLSGMIEKSKKYSLTNNSLKMALYDIV